MMDAGAWVGLCGIAVGVASAIGGAVWGHLNGRISKNVDVLHKRIDDHGEKMDLIQREYVRRDDLRDDVQRIERGQDNLAGKVDNLIIQIAGSLAKLASAAVARRDDEQGR